MKKSLIPAVFWILVVIFVVIVVLMFMPVAVVTKRALFPFVAVLSIPFILLGLALVFFTLKEKVDGPLKKFLILTGIAPAAVVLGTILHNVFYAFGVITSSIPVLHFLMEAFHIAFFIIAIFIAPLGFLVGAVGAAVLFVKKRNRF